jgi:predicted acetyltransferase
MPHNPNVFNEMNLDNLLVLRDREHICSCVGLNPFEVTSMGCTFSAGCIGGVHTHEDYRKRGFATQILHFVFERCRNSGVDFLAISGRRGLYSRNHAMLVGATHRFSLSAEQAASFAAGGFDLQEFQADHLPELARLHALEPVRIIRPRRVWELFLETRACHFAPSKTYIVRRHNMPVAYLIVRGEVQDGAAHVLEFAGDRSAVCASLQPILQEQMAERIVLTAMEWDSPLIWQLEAGGLEPQRIATDGSVVVINFEQIVDKYRPHMAERVGKAAEELVVEADGENVTFCLAEDRLEMDVDAATRLLFGTSPGEEEPVLGTSSLADVLRTGFPIQLPAYGMDYI